MTLDIGPTLTCFENLAVKPLIPHGHHGALLEYGV